MFGNYDSGSISEGILEHQCLLKPRSLHGVSYLSLLCSMMIEFQTLSFIIRDVWVHVGGGTRVFEVVANGKPTVSGGIKLLFHLRLNFQPRTNGFIIYKIHLR
jgi:hypothetical protein